MAKDSKDILYAYPSLKVNGEPVWNEDRFESLFDFFLVIGVFAVLDFSRLRHFETQHTTAPKYYYYQQQITAIRMGMD